LYQQELQITSSVEDEVMTHLKNTTAPSEAQLPQLGSYAFGGSSATLFTINEDQDLLEGLQVASDLSEGIRQLCDRLDQCINEGEIMYCAEIRALGFLGDVVGVLTRSAHRALDRQRNAAEGGAK
jgi:hypothetical protein